VSVATATQAFALEAEKAEKEIADLISRVMQASSARVITAYETRIEELEKTKAILQEKALKTHAPKHSFDKMLELSLLFLASPYKLWSLGSFEVRRIVLKLASSGPITYDQKTGARTPLKAAVHKAFMPLLPAALQNGAVEKNRTSTGLLPQRPQRCASTVPPQPHLSCVLAKVFCNSKKLRLVKITCNC
jgi:hypothetical protein